MSGPLSGPRPAGLRRRHLAAGTELWRIDADGPEAWRWAGFPGPRHRFDPESGRSRVRYAASSIHGAARERYLATGRYIPADHAGHHLVRLEARRALRVLDLRTEANLDALGLDDRVSTSLEAPVLAVCHQLADAIRGWWDQIDGIVYRSRTTPTTSANLAFFSLDGMAATSRTLAACQLELDDLVLRYEFTVGFEYPS